MWLCLGISHISLFTPRFAAPDEDADDDKAVFDKYIMPENIFCLEASDEFLKDRVMNLPESHVAGTHNTEEGLSRRLAEYRSLNTEDDTVLNFFDEYEVHPEKLGEVHVLHIFECFL